MSEQPASPADVPAWDVADRMRKSLRHANGGVAEMADYLGVSRASVSNWINGRIEPSTQTLRLWAMRTGVSYEWLAGARDFRRRGFSSRPTSTPVFPFRTQGALAA
jgi:transcriptional regulator with XRE-family HTH domain